MTWVVFLRALYYRSYVTIATEDETMTTKWKDVPTRTDRCRRNDVRVPGARP